MKYGEYGEEFIWHERDAEKNRNITEQESHFVRLWK